QDKLKDFLDKKEKGELLIQKASNLLGNILKKTELSVSHDGYLHFGDIVCVYNPASEVLLTANMSESKMRDAQSLGGPCDISASKSLQPCVRNTFMIVRFVRQSLLQGFKDFEGRGGSLTHLADDFILGSLHTSSFKKRQNLVVANLFLCSLIVFRNCLCFDPQQRLENDGMPVPANQRILFNHCKTNQNLACMSEFSFR
ncbi:predicted protein, partial [Nematostella vectensis]